MHAAQGSTPRESVWAVFLVFLRLKLQPGLLALCADLCHSDLRRRRRRLLLLLLDFFVGELDLSGVEVIGAGHFAEQLFRINAECRIANELPGDHQELIGLVACGQLVDDSGRWCEAMPPRIERGDRKRTEIILEDMEV